MNLGVLLASTLWLLSPAAQYPPSQNTPLSNTFITAAESVIDDANAVEVKADDDHFTGQLQTVKSAKDNLNGMASGEREHDIVSSMNDLIFAISACHIQAKDGADTAKCQGQINNARHRAMDLLNKHKDGDSWADGPPA